MMPAAPRAATEVGILTVSRSQEIRLMEWDGARLRSKDMDGSG